MTIDKFRSSHIRICSLTIWLLLLHHLLLLHCHLSLGHLLGLHWVELVLHHLAGQVVSREQNCHVVSVEYLLHIQTHQVQISIRLQRNSFDKEHRIFKSLRIWFILGRPSYAHYSLFFLRSYETHVRRNLNWNWCRSVHEESNWAMLYRIHYLKLSIKMTLIVLRE